MRPPTEGKEGRTVRKLLVLGSAAIAVIVVGSVAQAAPQSDKIAGSGTWSANPAFGTPTVNVNASDQSPAPGKNNNKFTFDYKNPPGTGETVYLVQGKIVAFEVDGTTACLVGQVTKEQGQDPASAGNERFDVGEYVPIAISEGGPTGHLFNFGVSQPSQPSVSPCAIGADLPFDAGTAEFSIFDAD
jgi:hypothetical protein